MTRVEKMIEMRGNGATTGEIAAEFGITRQRVSQMLQMHEEKIRRRNDPLYIAIHSATKDHPMATRIYNVLHRNKVTSLEDLQSKTVEDIMSLRNVGEKSFVYLGNLIKQVKQ